jgi:hypothetical protein
MGRKPSGIACPHAGALGCRIHAKRPRICADFACAWLLDTSWPPSWRPDRSGLLCLDEAIPSGPYAATVLEIQPGALLKSEAADIVNHLLQTAIAVSIVDAQGRCESVLGRTEVGPIADRPCRLAG